MHDRDTAAKTFRLYRERIGDIFVLGERHVAFGSLEKTREPIAIRSHGSRFESTVPILCYGRKVPAAQYEYSLDLSRHFSWHV